MTKKISAVFMLFFLIIILMTCTSGFSLCKGSFLNPVTDVAWPALFPIKIGGVTLLDASYGDDPTNQEDEGSILCLCPASGGGFIVGINVSFWEPYRIIESVMDPGCFPSLGIDIDLVADGRLEGVNAPTAEPFDRTDYFSTQVHYIISPVLSILGILKDITCKDNTHTDIDIAYLTELDPLWQDPTKSIILSPEALVFANPVTGFACMADAVAASARHPLNTLFWCLGTWNDGVYPFVACNTNTSPPDGHAIEASRMIFKLAREGLLWDRAVDECAEVMTPIWYKTHWQLQPFRPGKLTSGAVVIGEPSEFWCYKTQIYDPQMKGSENWAFFLWRKIHCCMGLNPTQ